MSKSGKIKYKLSSDQLAALSEVLAGTDGLIRRSPSDAGKALNVILSSTLQDLKVRVMKKCLDQGKDKYTLSLSPTEGAVFYLAFNKVVDDLPVYEQTLIADLCVYIHQSIIA